MAYYFCRQWSSSQLETGAKKLVEILRSESHFQDQLSRIQGCGLTRGSWRQNQPKGSTGGNELSIYNY